MEGWPSFWGLQQIFLLVNLYTITGMDAAAVDLVTGIWVEVVVTVGVGAVGFGVDGIGWVSTHTLYLLLVSTDLLLYSLALGPRALLVIRLVFWGWALSFGCGWVHHGWVWG